MAAAPAAPAVHVLYQCCLFCNLCGHFLVTQGRPHRSLQPLMHVCFLVVEPARVSTLCFTPCAHTQQSGSHHSSTPKGGMAARTLYPAVVRRMSCGVSMAPPARSCSRLTHRPTARLIPVRSLARAPVRRTFCPAVHFFPRLLVPHHWIACQKSTRRRSDDTDCLQPRVACSR